MVQHATPMALDFFGALKVRISKGKNGVKHLRSCSTCVEHFLSDVNQLLSSALFCACCFADSFHVSMLCHDVGRRLGAQNLLGVLKSNDASNQSWRSVQVQLTLASLSSSSSSSLSSSSSQISQPNNHSSNHSINQSIKHSRSICVSASLHINS